MSDEISSKVMTFPAAPTTAPTPAPASAPAPSRIPSDLLAVLSGLRLEDEAAVVRAAEAWCRENEPHSIEEIVEHDLVDDFADTLGLPPSPAGRLRHALSPSAEPQPSAAAASLSLDGQAAAQPEVTSHTEPRSPKSDCIKLSWHSHAGS